MHASVIYNRKYCYKITKVSLPVHICIKREEVGAHQSVPYSVTGASHLPIADTNKKNCTL